MVYDCRPQLLPVSLQLSDIGPLSGLLTVVSASVAVGLTISGVGSDGLVVPELGVAPLGDSGTDLEDELPTPDGSPSTDAAKPGEVVIPEVGPAPRDVDLELARALLEVAVLPLMVTPIIDPVVEPSVMPALYPVPPIVEKMVPGSVEGSPTGEPVAAPSLSMPDLSREGPFDVHRDTSRSGASPRVLDSLRGCQYRMTSYDEDTSSSEFNPAYGIHLHDPLLLEYVGAPESARILSLSPEYWLHYMGHERTLSAALQLQHDAGLILSNLQVLQQFVISLNRMSSEVMRVAFDREPFPSEAVQTVAHYMVAMGLWRPPSTQGIHGPLPSSSCNACMSCFPDLPQWRFLTLVLVFSLGGRYGV